MAKLYFRYAAMNAGKSTALLQVAHNYEELGRVVRVFTAALDNRFGTGRVTARLGVTRPAELFEPNSDFGALLDATAGLSCVLVDEAQFLSAQQVRDLHRWAHLRGIPVICYGLRTDFRGAVFPGASELLALADDLEEIKTICPCGRKASMNRRRDASGQPVLEGDQVEIGGNERYQAVCPRCFYNRVVHPAAVRSKTRPA